MRKFCSIFLEFDILSIVLKVILLPLDFGGKDWRAEDKRHVFKIEVEIYIY